MALTKQEYQWICRIEKMTCHSDHLIRGTVGAPGMEGRVESLEQTRVDNQTYNRDTRRQNLLILIAIIEGAFAILGVLFMWI